MYNVCIIFGENTIMHVTTSLDFSKQPTTDEGVLLVKTFYIRSSSWTWSYSCTETWLQIKEKVTFDSLRPSLLLNPDKTFRAFGTEAKIQYSHLCEINENSKYYFFDNITRVVESEQVS